MAKKDKKKKVEKDNFNFIDDQLNEQIDSRPISFYLNSKNKLSKISTIFLVITILSVFFGKMIIEVKNKGKTDYVTNVFGTNTEYIQTERRQEIIRDFIEHQNKKEQ